MVDEWQVVQDTSQAEGAVLSMDDTQFQEEVIKLLGIMQKQLQAVLLGLVKSVSTAAKKR